MQTFGDLRALADDNLYGGQYAEALALYSRLVMLRPADLDARMRVGDTLMAMGDVQNAAVIYTRLAQHAARAGYPLRAMVAVKVLSSLEPQLGVLLDDVARLYAGDSSRIGRGVRRAPPDPKEALPADWHAVTAADGDRVAQAMEAAGTYPEGALIYPERLIPIPLLSLLPTAEFVPVLHAVKLTRARPGTVILEQGKPGHSFFVIARGKVDVTRTADDGSQQMLATLHDGAIFGEMALLSAEPRSATATANGDCDLLEFDREALLGASGTLDAMQNALSIFARERLLQNVFSTSGVFRPLDTQQRMALMKRFVAVNVEPNQILIQEGQAGQGLFVVLRGEVVVTKQSPTGDQELARMGPGEAFGEISLLNEEPTTATVTATGTGSLLFLGREYFQRLLDAIPEVRAYLEQVSDERQMDMRLSLDQVEPLDLDADDQHDADLDIEVLI